MADDEGRGGAGGIDGRAPEVIPDSEWEQQRRRQRELFDRANGWRDGYTGEPGRSEMRAAIEATLPAFAIVEYRMLVGGLFGDTLEDVVRHALISFLHDRALTLERFMPAASHHVEMTKAVREYEESIQRDVAQDRDSWSDYYKEVETRSRRLLDAIEDLRPEEIRDAAIALSDWIHPDPNADDDVPPDYSAEVLAATMGGRSAAAAAREDRLARVAQQLVITLKGSEALPHEVDRAIEAVERALAGLPE
jgi:hypothetical protein